MKHKETPLGLKPNGLSYTVLLIDDSRTAREILKQMLLSLQFKVIDEAENGEIAMHKIQTSKLQPDFLFIDMEMPLMNGVKTIKNLKPLLSETRIIMVTSRSDRELVSELISLGVNGFIKKPYDRDTVISKLTSLIRSSEGE